jgi:catechol 2,3-dioxygenase-like lactoylglutathione lyase family enzyme
LPWRARWRIFPHTQAEGVRSGGWAIPIDHVSVGVRDVAKAQAFYDPVLAPCGMNAIMPIVIVGQVMGVGYGESAFPVFWIGLPFNREHATVGNGVHICFTAPSRAAVDEFYRAALAAGGSDDGPPGLRPHYHANYYGAFVRDLDGNKIEAACHKPA